MSGSTFTVACGSGTVAPLAEAVPTDVFMTGGEGLRSRAAGWLDPTWS